MWKIPVYSWLQRRVGSTAHFLLESAGDRSNVTQELPPNVKAEIEEACKAAGVTLIDLEVRGQHRQLKLDVSIDALEGIQLEQCRSVSRGIDDRLAEDEFFSRLQAVDVSSPGAEAPVKFLWQLTKHVGRTVRVTKTDSTVLEGKLQRADESGLDLQPKGTKNRPEPLVTIPSDGILTAHVVISFS